MNKEIPVSMFERMDNAKFNITTDLCSVCKYQIMIPYNNNSPEEPLSKCEILGKVPSAIYNLKCHKCKAFEIDVAEYEINKPFLPKDFDPSKVNE